jgi:hypothetical protein
MARTLRGAIWSVDADQPILAIETIEAAYEEFFARPRFYALLMSVFAGLGLLIAGLGLYGVVAYATASPSTSAKNRWRDVSSPSARKRDSTTPASPSSPGLPGLRSGKRCTNARVSANASAPLNASGARSDAWDAGRDPSENMATMSASRAGTNDAL